MNAAYPDIKILVTLAYSLAHGDDAQNNMKYGLLPAFLDGMNEAADPRTIIYDGWEYSYNYATEKQFADVRSIIRQKTPDEWSAFPNALREHWRASFGLWVDYGEDAKWNQTDFSKNFFLPGVSLSNLCIRRCVIRIDMCGFIRTTRIGGRGPYRSRILRR